MSYYSEYLEKKMSIQEIQHERKHQLSIISKLRQRDIMVYAGDPSKNGSTGIDYSDVLPFSDQFSMLKSENIDIILETPGGFAEIVEELVKLIRKKHTKVGIIVPGCAKSAGTIFALAADEILMGDLSSLGPIDAQIMSNGKRYSADAFLEGLKKIMKDSHTKQRIELGYIPILQNISPGEIQHCENAQNFSKTLVKEWLKEYKFKFWDTHLSTGEKVTSDEKDNKAQEIASALCNHNKWLTHGRCIKIDDLINIGLKITDYSKEATLNEAITKYYTLLRMTFESDIYKIYETSTTQIYRSHSTANQNNSAQPMIIQYKCKKCGENSEIQVNFDSNLPLKNGAIKFPQNNIFKCPYCKDEFNIIDIRKKIELQFHKQIV